jgi:hypothetical protein
LQNWRNTLGKSPEPEKRQEILKMAMLLGWLFGTLTIPVSPLTFQPL